MCMCMYIYTHRRIIMINYAWIIMHIYIHNITIKYVWRKHILSASQTEFYNSITLGKRRRPPCLALRSGKGPVPAPQTKASKVRMWQLRHAMGRTLICNDYHANSWNNTKSRVQFKKLCHSQICFVWKTNDLLIRKSKRNSKCSAELFSLCWRRSVTPGANTPCRKRQPKI